MKNILSIGLFLLLGQAAAYAQTPYDSSIKASPEGHEIPINRGSTALWQSLKKLHTRASLVMVTAHPDDEDGGMLAYESRGQGARVILLTLNRGEGGANVMSANYFDGAWAGANRGVACGRPLLGRGAVLDAAWSISAFRKRKAESHGASGRTIACCTTWCAWCA